MTTTSAVWVTSPSVCELHRLGDNHAGCRSRAAYSGALNNGSRRTEGMVDFGISLGAPSAEDMGDRHTYYRDLLRRADGAFTSAWVADHLMKDDLPMLEGWTAIAFLAAE